jgi:hypothetical protein
MQNAANAGGIKSQGCPTLDYQVIHPACAGFDANLFCAKDVKSTTQFGLR